MRKTFLILVAAVLSVALPACSGVNSPNRVSSRIFRPKPRVVTPKPPVVVPPVVVPPVIVTPLPDGEVTPPSTPISRDLYNSVPGSGTNIAALKATMQVSYRPIPQPLNGVNLRYPVLDSDGKYRGRYANFVFNAAGTLIRKSIS